MNATIHIRREDEDKWKALSNKSEFIHTALNATEFVHEKGAMSTAGFKSIKTPKMEVPEHHLYVDVADTRPIPKSFTASKKK